jgi:hypothetical protein
MYIIIKYRQVDIPCPYMGKSKLSEGGLTVAPSPLPLTTMSCRELEHTLVNGPWFAITL